VDGALFCNKHDIAVVTHAVAVVINVVAVVTHVAVPVRIRV